MSDLTWDPGKKPELHKLQTTKCKCIKFAIIIFHIMTA